MINPRFLPLLIISCLIATPMVFLVCLNHYFSIVKYDNINISDIQSLLNFAKLIFENIGERKLKSEIWASIFYSFIPLMFLLALLLSAKKPTSHGKARYATNRDIETYQFDATKFKKDIKAFVNPKNLIHPKRFFSNLKELLSFGMVKVYPIRMNFDKGFLLGSYKGLLGKKKVYYNAPLATFIVAPPGSGKSAAVIIPNLLSLPTSCIVTDIKGELFSLTAGYRQKVLKNKIYCFDPFGTDNNIEFNPFDKKIIKTLNFNQKKRLVDEISNTIFVEEKGGNDAHWIESAKNLFKFYAMYYICCYGETNFFDVQRATKQDFTAIINPKSKFARALYEINDDGEIIYDDNGKPLINLDANAEKLWYQQVSEQKYTNPSLDENFKDETQEEIDDNLNNKGYELLDDIVRDEARKLANMNVNEFASIKSVFSRMMNIFSNYDVKNATSAMSFEYEDLRKENITIYIKIQQTDIDTLAPLIRIFLESIAKNLMTKESKGIEGRIYMLLDEFIRFGKLPFLTEMPALCRSYNIVPVYVTQDFAMIEKHYSKEDLRTMNGNIAFRIIFRMNDYESAEAVSKEIGNYTRENRNVSTSGTKFLETGSSISKEGVALISAQDILNLSDDDIIVTSTGNKAKPLKLKAYYYFKQKAELSKLKIKFDSTQS